MLRVISSRASHSSYGALAASVRTFTASCLPLMKQMPPRPPPVNEDDISEAFLKGSGPGGQKIVGQLPALLCLDEHEQLFHKVLQKHLNPTNFPHPEQNLISCPAETPAYRNSR
jgi:hypothetical protein